MNKRGVLPAILWLLCLLLPISVQAQSTNASVNGTVLDPSGAVVPGAELALTSVATGVVSRTVSDQEGRYSFPNLQSGTYELKALAQGFQEYVRKGLAVALNAAVRLDINLALGAGSLTVEVSGNASQLTFDSGEQKSGIDPGTINQLPLIVAGGPRSAASFVTLMPGVTTGSGGSASAARINGGQDWGDEAVLDGVSMQQGAMSQSGMISINADFQFSPDMVSEVQVLTSNYEPQYGSTTSGQIIATTKSGTTEFHGAGYDYYRSTGLNARQFGAEERAPTLQHDVGGNIGGPVKLPVLWSNKVKTFFYVNYEGFRIRGGVNKPTLSIPSLKERAGDFSDWRDTDGNLIPIFDPATTRPNQNFDPNADVGPDNLPYLRDQFMGCDGNSPNVICSSRFQNSLALEWFKFLPTPTSDGPLYNYQVPKAVPDSLQAGSNNWLIKANQYIGSKDHFSLTFYRQSAPPQFNSLMPPQLATEEFQKPFNAAVNRFNWDHTFTPSLLNHFAFGYLNRMEGYGSVDAEYVNDLPQIQGVAAATSPPVIGFGDGFETFGNPRGINTTNVTSRPAYILNDLVTWVKGKHTFKFGAEYRNLGENNDEGNNTSGEFYFNGATTGLQGLVSGNSIASFLLEDVSDASVNFRYVASNYPRSVAWIAHFGDTWKVTSKLTLNYGIRWDMFTPTAEKYDRFSFFDPLGPNPDAGGRPGRLAYAGAGWGEASFGRRTPEYTWKKGFAPRLGLAYALTPNTVIRTGYGIFYSQAFCPGWRGCIGVDGGISGQAGFITTPEFSSSLSGMEPAFKLSAGFPQDFQLPPAINPSFQNGQDIFYRPFDANRLPYSQQWNLTVEHQFAKDVFVSAAYVGNKGTRLLSTVAAINVLNPSYLSMGQALFDEFQPGDTELNGVPVPYEGWVEQMVGCAPTVAQALLPYPQYCSNLQGLNENAGNSTFHSFQLKVEKRFSGGTFFLASYTLSKMLTSSDSTQQSQGAFEGVSGVISPFERKRNKALSYADVPQTLSLAFVWDFPVGKGQRFLNQGGAVNAILGGWSMSTTFRATSGTPFYFRSSNCNVPGQFGAACIPSVLLGANPWAQDKKNFDPNMPLFNLAAFQDVNSFNFYLGDGPRVSNLRGFGYQNQDLALVKDINITERWRIQLRAEFFNLWNWHTFSAPGPWSGTVFDIDIASPTFGMWDGSVSDPRNIQLGARISF